ncbi:MAG: hypothetical protein WC722_16140 [Rhodospirillales bacterium]|jgi:hypothetical protein
MWDEFVSCVIGIAPLPHIVTHALFAMLVGFGTGCVTAAMGLEALAPFAAVIAFISYVLIAVLAALRHRS